MSKQGLFITDDELLAAGVSELDIDRLNRRVETQLVSVNGRDRAAVEAALAERLNHDKRGRHERTFYRGARGTDRAVS